jgi:hypothetical protein
MIDPYNIRLFYSILFESDVFFIFLDNTFIRFFAFDLGNNQFTAIKSIKLEEWILYILKFMMLFRQCAISFKNRVSNILNVSNVF